MITVVEYLPHDSKSRKSVLRVAASRLTHISVSTGDSDVVRCEAFNSAVNKIMRFAKHDETVEVRVAVSLKDSISLKVSELQPIMIYATVREVKERYEQFNIMRVNDHMVGELLNKEVRRLASDVSISDAMEMMGIPPEESSKYLNKEGEYEYPDLIGKWGSLFTKRSD